MSVWQNVRPRDEVVPAESAYREALPVFIQLGDRYGEASTYAHLADLVNDADARQQAKAILRELDPSAAAQLKPLLG